MEMRQQRPEVSIVAISGGRKRNPTTYLEIAKNIGAVVTMTKPVKTAKRVATVEHLLAGNPHPVDE